MARPRLRAGNLADSLPATDHEFTVILPAYNEERRLPKSLEELGQFLDATRLDYRVIVADDGSRDRTPELADGFGSRFSTVRLEQNGGKGRAIRTAMLAATGQVVAFTDADLPFRLTALRQGYDLIAQGQCEIAFGSRHMAQSANVARRNLMRRIASRAFHGVVKCLVSTDVTDTQCGLKLFSRRAAVEIFSRMTVDGFAFDTEVVLLARRLKLAHRCLPVTLVNEMASTVSLARHALPMLLDVVKMRARLDQLQLSPELPADWGRLSAPPARRAA
ncbi:MAG TPA: dolichyl-phosphate beta-glucosyltransferase [Pirellulales bacterium]|nr:dolichyl-phosphate beta-glucosyltransferase [Pirellulales bacterium]